MPNHKSERAAKRKPRGLVKRLKSRKTIYNYSGRKATFTATHWFTIYT